MIKLGKWITKHRVIILIVACPTLWKPYRVRTFC